MRTYRMIPPPLVHAGANRQAVNVAGRGIGPNAQGFAEVAASDVAPLMSNGWAVLCMCGPTASRPATTDPDAAWMLHAGLRYYDTDLGALIAYAASDVWHDVATGDAV